MGQFLSTAPRSIGRRLEMALLQLDMLAYLDDTSPEQTVVIGAGIPPDWPIRPMKVMGSPCRPDSAIGSEMAAVCR